MPISPFGKGKGGGFALLALSIHKGQYCNLDVYKSLPAKPIVSVNFEKVRAVRCGFFSISIDLEGHPVQAPKLAYILNAYQTRSFGKTTKSANQKRRLRKKLGETVTPAEAGVQNRLFFLDSGLRRNDAKRCVPTFYWTVKRVCSLGLGNSNKIVRLAFKEVLNGTEN